MRLRARIFALLTTALIAGFLVWPRGSRVPSISAEFTHYGTNWSQMVGFIIVSNSGNSRVLCRGVGASSEQQLTQILSAEGWTNTRPWLSPDAAGFYLLPGETQEVPILIQTNLPWRIGFRFRETSFVDRCPWFIWQHLPERMKHIPDFRVVWTSPVAAFSAYNSKPLE